MIAGFLHHAVSNPDAVALTIRDRDYSYAEAADIGSRWAAGLMEVTKGRPGRVAVFGMRNETSYFGTLAALMAGAAFVPLNKRFPPARTRTMLELADVDAVIVDGASVDQMNAVMGGLSRPPALVLPQTRRESSVPATAAPEIRQEELMVIQPITEAAEVNPTDLAYLMFTSGSTGTPKGVPITHRNVQAFLDVNSTRYQLGKDDRLSQTFEPTFDLSVFDVFMAWENGARVCAMDPIELLSPVDYIERHGITVWFSVPSVAAALHRRGALRPNTMPTVRWSLFCGEALTRDVAEAWQSAAAHSTVENLYGPTELTIACSVHRWNPQTSPAQCAQGLVPIGNPYPGMDGLIVDADMTCVPDGETGELCMTGPQTAPGYWRSPHSTAERFVEHRGRIYYRTGDLVCRQANGELVYLGRNDQQVKLRGYRVELGEIEAALRQAGSAEAVCLMWPDDQTLTAIVSGAVDPTTLAEHLTRRLPAYMRPRSIHCLPHMLMTVNGKVDRQALKLWLHESQETSSQLIGG